MPKQLNVNLAFTADTSGAKNQIEQLQQQLTNLIQTSGQSKGQFALTKEIQQATNAAAQLQAQIKSATDVDTGKLDLTKFTQSMTQSGMSLRKYQQQLSQLGPSGDKAFASLAASINNADARLKNANTVLNQFATTLKNTARWQISSSMLHGFMGSIQAAYGYAQDLNQSLNNIRIVTGASTDEMANFAIQANKAAQALSTTTTQYTDAALIYYQQGIRDQEEIAGRTETTIKLANVSRQSAEEVSDEMTAIWNNFYDGSQSLEYYADVITALGAATASSSEEISTGLEKFAAVSKTVGLSYEYATAALATITATTRQSADTVGTGLRTLFSRLEGLKLGETLEDGVDLNKYSQALESVGVQVLDVSGELRNMDDILNDLGDRWGELSQAQKMALAQTVGGVRQYTNLIALMDNWDFMKENLGVAQGAEGTLQEQADIYAESWEAARKRVKAAAEDIYGSIFDDKFFINLTNGFANFLKVIDDAVSGLGGMKGVLLLIGSIATKIFNEDLTKGIAKLTSGFQLAMMGGQQYVEQQRKESNALLAQQATNDGTMAGAAIASSYQQQAALQDSYLESAQKLSTEQRNIAQILLDQNKILGDNVRVQAELTKEAQKTASENERALKMDYSGQNKGGRVTQIANNLRQRGHETSHTEEVDKGIYDITRNINGGNIAKATGDQLKPLAEQIQQLRTGFKELGTDATTYLGKKAGQAFDEMAQYIDKDGNIIKGSIGKLKTAYSSWSAAAGENKEKLQLSEKELNKYATELTGVTAKQIQTGEATEKEVAAFEKAKQVIQEVYQSEVQEGIEDERLAETIRNLTTSTEGAIIAFEQFQQIVSAKVGQGIIAATSSLMSFGMALSSIKSLGSIWSNEDISLGEKLISTMTSLGIIIPAVTSAFRAESIEKIKGLKLSQEELASLFGLVAVKEQEAVVGWQTVAAKEAEEIASAGNVAAEGAETVATAIDTGVQESLAAAIWKVVAARIASLSAMLPYIGYMLAAVAAVAAVVTVIKGLINVYHADALAAEEAADAASKLKDKYNETKQAYEDLKSTIEDHANAVNAIKDLEKGTLEWRDAIRDANTEALELINTLGLVKDADYTIDKDGVIRIDQDALDQALAAKSEEVATAQANSIMADQTAKNAQLKSDQTDLRRSALGSGVDVDKAIERLTSGDLAKDFAKNALSDEVLKTELQIDDDELLAGIKELAASINQNTDMQQVAAEQAAQAILQGNDKVQNSGYADDISKAAGQIYDDAYQKAYDKYMDTPAMNQDLLKKQYLEESGATELKGFKETNSGYSYVDERGQPQKVEVTQEDIAMTLAAADANKQLAEASDNLVDAFADLDKKTGDAAKDASNQGIKSFLANGDLSGATKSQFAGIQSGIKEAGGAEAYLGNSLGDKDGSLSNEEARALGYESAAAMVSAFSEGIENADDNFKEAGQDLIPNFMQKAFDAVSDNSDISASGKTAMAEAIDSALEMGGNEAAKSLMNQFTEAAEAGELTDDKIEDIITSAEELQTIDLSTLTSQVAEINSILNGLETGDSISADDYAKLSEEQQSYFALAMDGTYQLIGSAEELKSITEEANFDKFRELGGQAADTANTFNSAADIGADRLSQSASTGVVPGTKGSEFTFDSSVLETQLGLIREFQDELDISNAQLADWQEALQNGTVDPAMLRDVAAAVGELNLTEEQLAQSAQDATAKQTELQTALALTASNTNELQEMLDNGDIGVEAFNKGMKKLHNTLDEDVDTEQYEELSDYFEEFGDSIKGVSKDMKGNKKAARELAKEISRFDAAVESVSDNYDDWKKDLKSTNKDATTHAKTIKGLRNAYGDLLDVSGDTLSQNFLENAENLDLMAKAAEGDEEAYNKLQDAVREDIAAQAHFDDDQFQSDFDELLSKYYEGQNLDDIEVGAALDNQQFLDGLTDMVNAAGMTAQQATDYLASMGVDAEVIETNAPSTETTEVVGYTASGGTVSQSYSIPKVSGSGENMSVDTATGTATFPYFTVSEDVNTVTTTKDNKATSLQVTSASKSSGGGFKYKNSSAGGGGGSGSCFIAGTLITTIQGFKNIEDIQIGDIVLSYNEQIKQNEYSVVAQTMTHIVAESIYNLYINDEILQVTGIHRFFITRNNDFGWIHTKDLQIGDLVLFADGTWHIIENITTRFKFCKVYNFEVSNIHNYYVGFNQILAHNKGGSRGRRRGGGRRVERQTNSNYKTGEDAGERYHVIQQKLTSLSAAYDKVSAAADRAFGKDKIKLLNKQIAAQDKLIESQKEYLKQIKANIKTDTKNLSYAGTKTYYSEIDGKKKTVNVSADKYLGMKLDIDPTTGALNNYDELIEAANKKYNAKLDWYNKLSGKNQEKNATKKAMEENEQQYQAFMDMIQQYEDTIHLYEDEAQVLQDMKDEKYDLQLEKVDIEVNYKIDIQDDQLKIVDLLLQQIEDDASKAVERINLIGKQASAAESKMKTYRQGIQAIFTAHDEVSADEAKTMMSQLTSGNAQDSIAMLKDKGVKLTEKEVDQLRSYVDGLLSETQNLMEYRKEVVQEISNVMDDNVEKMDRINNKMEKLKTVTNSYKNLIDLTGKKYLKISSDLYDQIEETNVQLAQQSLDNARVQKEQAAQQLTYLKDEYAKVASQLSDAEKKEWEDRVKEAEDYVDEMTENFYASWEEGLEAVSTRFESAMTNMVADFSTAMAGMAGNLEGLQTQFDLKKTVEEVYVPDYEKIYQLTKLTRDAQKEIDSATNVKVKKELQGVQEKILALQQSGEKVSQYELDYLQKELELKKAQLALEEASEVKSQVRMSRDSEGNFSYVYTANQGAVEDAEAEYANKLYEMQKLNEEYINDMQSQIISMEQDYANALQEAADIYGVGTTEYYNALMSIEENYSAFFDNLNSELNLALQNQDETQNAHAALYVALTGDTMQAAAQVTTQWEDTTLATLTGFQTASQYQAQWKTASQEAYEAATQAAQTWEEDTTAIYESAGSSITTFGTDTNNTLESIKEEGDALVDSFNSVATAAESNFEAAVTAVTNWESQHSAAIESAIQSNQALIESINDIIKAWEGASESIEAIKDLQTDSIKTPTSVAATTATTAAEKTAFQKAIEKKAKQLATAAVRGLRRGRRGTQTRKRYDAAYRAAYDKALKSLSRNASKKAKNAKNVRDATRALTRKVIKKAKKGLKKTAKKAYKKRYDTGGYTGDWVGNGGKEAILHKKELVLNAKDTENMLKTVDIVRSIANIINLNAISSSGGLSQLNAPGAPVTAGQLDQQVTITAEFPNATDRNEILSAFDNIINLASQYANR